MVKAVGSHLSYLEINGCRRITEFGLIHLERCSGLKSLLLCNLRRVHNHDKLLDNNDNLSSFNVDEYGYKLPLYDSYIHIC
ncbi:hypothetical protein NECAME_12926 [Necator americanus]|uniref:Uncharacterized protein n=1 Tax=Necator americanus TaxID=51031 RepID=W2SZV4_NECAM|nr:hypothetical protein NECAME_12926 [Necator americanus]ETN74546.1 hypothetical protein NECAME_12926 [Necator americanus]